MPHLDQLNAIISLLVPLSLASERLVEIVKGIVPWLGLQKDDAIEEGRRNSALQLLAVAAGITTALLARDAIGPMLPTNWNSGRGLLALGLLASGGSGLWNSVLTYVLKLKDIKKLEAEALKNDPTGGDVLGPLRP